MNAPFGKTIFKHKISMPTLTTTSKEMYRKIISYFQKTLHRKSSIDVQKNNSGKKRNFDLISIYFDLIKKDSTEAFIDETTWNDLDMDSVFSHIDYTVSAIGSQYLYSQMRSYKKANELDSQWGDYQLYLKDHERRRTIQRQLESLSPEGVHYIPNLIFDKLPQRPKSYRLFYLLSGLSLLTMAVIPIYQPALFIFLPIALCNIIISFTFGRKIIGYFDDLLYLSIMLTTGEKISKLGAEELEQIKQLRHLASFCTFLNRKISWLTIDKSKANELVTIIIDYFNHFCLFNILAFMLSIHHIEKNQDKLKTVFESIASLDAGIATAIYLEKIDYYCRPHFFPDNKLEVKEIYHPLLEKPVSNTLTLENNSALITGSNMAGKTTFIKTVGLNIILGRTLGFCLAKAAYVPKSIVKSSIRRGDDMAEHKSYYFKEIEAVLDFINNCDENDRYVFLIDEIFRGTNTIERIAAATSVLKHLAAKSTVFVTTHDIELQKLLAAHFEMYHFSEQVKGDTHYFDYKIQSGPTSSRNAIKLLELKGYPAKVVQEANELAEQLTTNGAILTSIDSSNTV
jgi:hypothetical protein